MKYKAFLSVPFLALCILSTGCNQQPGKIKYEPLVKSEYTSSDHNRNMYQIFPISFADSNGDGKGDIQGIIDKLDYVYNMNYNGIWLNPIGPSKTYHHYDVEDYCAISKDFGTIEDFDRLVSACHERGMTILIDLVINHSSNNHEWFQESYAAAKAGLTKDKDYQKYVWKKLNTGEAVPSGYHKVNGNDKICYEGRFDSSMPDLNLQQVLDDGNGDLATELKKIFKFWLVDHNIDGFRLDAVTSYFTDEQSKNKEFLTWLNTECKTLKPDCYIVGEGSWTGNSSENKEYQESGVDSFFQFGNMGSDGLILSGVRYKQATKLLTALERNEINANGGTEAPILNNHDTMRFAGAVERKDNNIKFALGILQQLKGATYMYYGDEMGMASQGAKDAAYNDSYYRLPVRWGDSYTCTPIKTPGTIDDTLCYPFKDVKSQLKDSKSIINYVKKANLIRLAFPEISKGTFEEAYHHTDATFSIVKRTYNDSSIYVAINASNTQSIDIDYTLYGQKVVAELCPNGYVKQNSANPNMITIPAQSIVIIK